MEKEAETRRYGRQFGEYVYGSRDDAQHPEVLYNQKFRPAKLDANHSHFVLVESESRAFQAFGAEVELRTNLEDRIAQTSMFEDDDDDDHDELTPPMVLIDNFVHNSEWYMAKHLTVYESRSNEMDHLSVP